MVLGALLGWRRNRTYSPTKGTNLSLFTSRYEDTWRQDYLGGTFSQPLGRGQGLSLNLNLYRSRDTGRAFSGRIDNTTWSLLGVYGFGAPTERRLPAGRR